MHANSLRRRLVPIATAALSVGLTLGGVGRIEAAEPFRGWAPLKTRPLRARYAIEPSTAIHPQPLVTIPPNPTPYPYGYFGAVGPHSNVQAGPGSSPGTRAWSYSFRR